METIGEVESVVRGADQPPLPRGEAGLGLVLASRCHRLEWLLIAIAAPLLLFPGRQTLLGAILLMLTWLARRIATGKWTVATPANTATRVLLAALCVSLVPSVALAYSAPKFWGLLLGVSVFYGVLNTCRSAQAYQRAAPVLLIGGLVLGLAGMVGTAQSGDKGLIFAPLYANLPHVLLPVQSSTTVVEGFNPNEVGGMLTLFIPLAGVLAIFGQSIGRATRAVAVASLPVLVTALLLTQSRAALAAVIAVLAVGGLIVARRRGRGSLALLGFAIALGGVIVVSTLAASRIDFGRLGLDDAPLSGTASLPGRAEIWQRAVLMIVDMPLSGIGLNTFPIILHAFYPTSNDLPASLTPHAHNLVLQTALDLGVVGLGAFAVIVALAAAGGIRAARHRQGLERLLAAGLGLGLLAYGIFNLIDAIALGAKPGPALWAILGLLIALGSVGEPARTRARPAPRYRRLLIGALTPLLLAPAGLNAARVGLHRDDLPPMLANAVIPAALNIAAGWGWGPYPARVWTARALEAKQRGDLDGELAALTAAASAAPGDASLVFALGEARLARGDLQGAVDAWRPARLDGPFLARASATTDPSSQLQWLALARQVNPDDWRPYADAAWILVDGVHPERPEAAAPLFAAALRLRGPQPALDVVAGRFEAPFAGALPSGAAPPTSQTDLQLLSRSVGGLATRKDYEGALYVTQLIARAQPTNAANWAQMARILREVGRAAEADQADARAGTPGY